ncbi:scavenger receptor cysteine-rich domain-containing protein DMBT1-like [Antedon mediterranea]|uniref:scavenger receptor cysteine-rich domain-containing protein DMBT1-like n=1 Tax=Antedon mediterranea TaxID=105859 RepID=UPI003AF928CF
MYMNGSWATVCNKNVDDRLAGLVCSQLGHSGGQAIMNGSGIFGPGDTGLKVMRIKCDENFEGFIHQCDRQSGITKRCNHKADVGIRCDYVAATTTEATEDEEEATTEDESQGITSEAHDDEDTTDVGSSEGDVKLADGQNAAEGRLEMYVNGSWATVCNKNVDDRLAGLVCSQLGHSGGQAMSNGSGIFGPGDTGLKVMRIKCDENFEGFIHECDRQSGITKRCNHKADVGIRCDYDATTTEATEDEEEATTEDESPGITSEADDDEDTTDVGRSEGDVRLADGQNAAEGRLEMYVNGSWATVCNKNFDDRLAGLVCSQLGHSSGQAMSNGSGIFGPGDTVLKVMRIKCDENFEGFIYECDRQSGITNRCNHNADVGVRCDQAV